VSYFGYTNPDTFMKAGPAGKDGLKRGHEKAALAAVKKNMKMLPEDP
jgi:hypothetical protein